MAHQLALDQTPGSERQDREGEVEQEGGGEGGSKSVERAKSKNIIERDRPPGVQYMCAVETLNR